MQKFVGDIKNTVINKLELPRELVKNSYKVVIEEDEFITIENHRGILTFKDDEIILKVDGGIFNIKGSKFSIVYISGKTLKLKGVFKGVSYEKL